MTSEPQYVLDGVDLFSNSDVFTAESQRVGIQLTDERQRLLAIIKEFVAAGDAAGLMALRTGSRVIHKSLGTITTLTRVSELTGEPFNGRDVAPIHAARALAALGLTLVQGPERAGEHLPVFHRWIACSGLAVAGEPVDAVPATLDAPHAHVVRHLARAGELDALSLTWMVELDGWLHPHEAGARQPARVGPSVHVLLDRGQQGQRAVLSLSTVPGLPANLIPDPRTMTLCSADAAFRASLATAWQTAGGARRGAVLWSLSDQAGPLLRVTNESLGAAFTVLLDEQRRLSRPVLGPLTVRRLRPRTAIVGRIDPNRPAAMSSVSGYDAKLGVVDEATRVVVPRADHTRAIEANHKYGDAAQLVPVKTWRQAARAGRAIATRRLLTIIAAGLVVVLLATAGLYYTSESQRDADQRRAAAADLAARSVSLRRTDPTLAAKLGLAAHHIDPGNARAVDALRDVLDDNRNVVRTWQADSSRLETLAVSQSLDRVVTSGSEDVTKVWTLSSGSFIGQVRKRTYLMDTAQSQAMVAAVTGDGLVFYDIGGDQPIELGSLPNATCTTTADNVTAVQFTRNDTNLVVVWQDGAISTYDVVTRQQTTCLRWQDTLTPLTFQRLPVAKVLAADVVDHDIDMYTPQPDDEIVLLLSNNTVVSVRLGSRDARVEVPAEKITGDASLVAASGDSVSVATTQGVAVWSRKDQALLANPAGGLSIKPRVLREAHGHLLISGDTGTVLVPLAAPSWTMAASLATPSGGAATVAAIDDRSIVAGGPGGRVSVIADSSGELAIGQRTLSTALAFLPDGQLLAADVPEASASGASASTWSSGLRLVDPKASKPADGTREPPVTRWTYGTKSTTFFANAVAATPGFVAAAGQTRSGGAVLAWPVDNHESPRELLLPPPDDTTRRPQDRIMSTVGFTPDGKLLVARHVSGQVGVWSTDSWQLLGTVDLRTGNPRMTIHGDRAVFVEGTDEQTHLVEVDLTTRSITHREPAPGAVFLAASADGSRVVTMTWDGAVHVRGADLAAVGDPWRPSASGDPVFDIAVDNNGQRLAIAQGDRVLIYDLNTKTLAMPPFDADGSQVVSVVWSMDGQLLAGTPMPPQRGNKQVIPLRVWKTGGLDWTSQVCRWASGGLSRSEWSQYVGDSIPFIDVCAEVRR